MNKSLYASLAALIVLAPQAVYATPITDALTVLLDSANYSLVTETAPEALPMKGAGQEIKLKLQPQPASPMFINVPVTGLVPVTLSVDVWTVNIDGQQKTDGVHYKGKNDDPVRVAKGFVFRPKLIHHKSGVQAGFDNAKIAVTIKLSAAGESVTRTINSGDIRIYELPIPKILALFRHGNFAATDNGNEGFVVVMVPSNSTLDSLPAVKSLLKTMEGVFANLNWLSDFASTATQLGLLGQHIADQPKSAFVVGARKSLNGVHLTNCPVIPVCGLDANDQISSIIFVAAPGYRSYFFSDKDYDQGEGYFYLTAPTEIVVRVQSLRSTKPDTDPNGRITVVKKDDDGNRFGDSLSSIRFSKPFSFMDWLRGQIEDE